MRCGKIGRRSITVPIVAFASILFSFSALAADACVEEQEPNETPETAQAVSGSFCVQGTISDSDQSIFAWTVDAEAAKRPWTVDLSGPHGQQTKVQIHRLEEPGDADNPAVVGPELSSLATPAGADTVQRANFFITPGVWLVGVSTSAGDGGAFQLSIRSSDDGSAEQAAASGATADQATQVAGQFALKGVVGSESWASWQLSPIEARKRWVLTATAPIGANVALELQSQDGKPILTSTQIAEGRLELADIGLPAGTYRIHLTSTDSKSYPYSLESASQGPRSPGREEEPNDSVLSARPLQPGQTMTGRIGHTGDVDTYVLPTTAVGQLLSVRLGGQSRAITRLCIGGADGAVLQCREGAMPSLDDIVITDTRRFVIISGGPSPDATYDLTAHVTGQQSADAESEPNDTSDLANTLAVPLMRGRFVKGDTDVFHFKASDSKPVTLKLTGEAATSLEVTDMQAQSSARVERATGADGAAVAGPLQLSNLTLAPGDYLVVVKGTDGAYTLETTISADAAAESATPTEREPNDAVEQAQALQEGERIAGVISPDGDIDQYRVSIVTPEDITIHFEQDPVCPVVFVLNWDSWSGSTPKAVISDKSFAYAARLRPNDYTISLQHDTQCEKATSYTIGFDATNLPAFGDVEPNDSLAEASAMPPDLKVEGTVGQFTDADWFKLPTVEKDTGVSIAVTGEIEVALTDGKPTSSAQLSQPTIIAGGDKGESVKGTVPAGATAAIRVMGKGAYTLAVTMDGREPVSTADAPVYPSSAAKNTSEPSTAGKSAPAGNAAPGALKAELKFAAQEIAAYWHRGQRVPGTLTVTNSESAPVDVTFATAGLRPGWRLDLPPTATIAANASLELPLALEVASDPYAVRPTTITVSMRKGSNNLASASANIAASISAQPIGDHLSFELPDELLGGFNVAWTALGGTLVSPPEGANDENGLANINDGLSSNAGYIFDAALLPQTATVRFGGDRTWPVRGITINPQTPGVWPPEYMANFELLVSADGTTFERVLTGEVSQQPSEQSFVLPKAIEAKAAQLRILSNHDGNLGRVAVSEWKVIVDPQVGIGAELDIADSLRGGHVVWSDPLISAETPVVKGVLEEGGAGPVVSVPSGVAPQVTIAFHEDRAAQIRALEWIDSEPANGAVTFPAVMIDASIETPLGPWTKVGEWKLGEGKSSTKTFEQPVWARFLRFTSSKKAGEGGETFQFPTKLRVLERASDANYRSILGEWGQYSAASFYEKTLPPPPVAKPESDDNDTREKAEPLPMDQLVSGRVEIGRDEDWFKIEQPDGMDRLTITLGGEPTIGADISLFDDAEKPVVLVDTGGTPRQADFEARVVPGKTYYLKVVQPPHSVMIAYDTSGSLLAFIPIIYNALEVFAAGVHPGQESVNFMSFDRPAMLADFSDQPGILKQALAKDARESSTSGLEGTAITALRNLSTRRGTRALLLVTDAASSTTEATTDLWKMIEQTRPRIFAAHAGSFDDPLREKQTMQDLSLASGGHYASSRSQPELDVSFDRVAAWLRRPAGYTLLAKAGKAAPPEPGRLVVSSSATPTNSEAAPSETRQGGLEIVLDASGSMLKHMDGRRRIEIARASLAKLVKDHLKPDDHVALRVFGHDKPGSCETTLVQPLAPLDAEAMTATVNGIVPQNLARTPIAASLSQVESDLKDATGAKTVILLTDGEETCGGDPRAVISTLAAHDIQVRVNIVGFSVDDPMLKGEFREWARIGRGRYFDAAKAQDLDSAIAAAAEVPFSAYDNTGNVVGQGTVNGPEITVPAGHYRVEIGSTPPQIFTDVMIKERDVTRLSASK
ncbi:vWA domain-containing protein [Hyphomicrobium methylovorum]|uniref:vWA domain-containing protein n=1 Tax=Hyphomicrobium methylovorum TaxID=84 RepID=UPI001AEE81E5|nr:VWA domain-containing protein [Hyphomicrobium methylovorum]